ncbi:hypothetical protein J2797_005086 [Paraburkholderia terricola]|uniref:hypothetical protein n=1 Tax=Paraburkholderia terricola TaxID=169427 RepID=UPI00285B671B|nr:hypothetical protein [Paraburkholderia terricola]MDR6495170.1 hypothetical protein [Paraburkholderia terricola]
MKSDHEQQELRHIRQMVTQLERLVGNGELLDGSLAVAQPGYWRGRISRLLDQPAAFRDTAVQASALLARLDGTAQALKQGE